VVARSYVPDAGDLVWLTFDPQAGHEQRGRRPALILSPRAYNAKARLAIACPDIRSRSLSRTTAR
jgi:mRNA interferase MazF